VRFRFIRRVLFSIFVVSTLVLMVVVTGSGDGAGVPDDPSAGVAGSTMATTVALLTSVTSLVGWVSTTALAWRKDRREATAHREARELERRRIEIEEARLELERERAGPGTDPRR
jgi:hypothetical protein